MFVHVQSAASANLHPQLHVAPVRAPASRSSPRLPTTRLVRGRHHATNCIFSDAAAAGASALPLSSPCSPLMTSWCSTPCCSCPPLRLARPGSMAGAAAVAAACPTPAMAGACTPLAVAAGADPLLAPLACVCPLATGGSVRCRAGTGGWPRASSAQATSAASSGASTAAPSDTRDTRLDMRVGATQPSPTSSPRCCSTADICAAAHSTDAAWLGLNARWISAARPSTASIHLRLGTCLGTDVSCTAGSMAPARMAMARAPASNLSTLHCRMSRNSDHHSSSSASGVAPNETSDDMMAA
mmetsp:Transcript_9285/g.23010  ORF Transcript_9285/g.23010 Transcript_9285/m.23010 type:complete len:299 (+) Transcript_9285:230-1126(+)